MEEAEKLYEIKLNLKSPNLFGNSFATNELLASVKKDFNNDELDLNLKNSNGNLKANRSELEDPIKYTGAGGGHWQLTIKRKGSLKKTIAKSSQNVKTVEITNFETDYKFISDSDIKKVIEQIEDK